MKIFAASSWMSEILCNIVFVFILCFGARLNVQHMIWWILHHTCKQQATKHSGYRGRLWLGPVGWALFTLARNASEGRPGLPQARNNLFCTPSNYSLPAKWLLMTRPVLRDRILLSLKLYFLLCKTSVLSIWQVHGNGLLLCLPIVAGDFDVCMLPVGRFTTQLWALTGVCVWCMLLVAMWFSMTE